METRLSRRRLEELTEEEAERAAEAGQIAYEPARPPLARTPEDTARAALLRGYGNHAVSRVLARDPNDQIAAVNKVKHKTGPEVDTALDASPYFKPLIAEGVAAGKQAAGHVHIHDDAEFDTLVTAYLTGKHNTATNAPYTADEAKEYGKRVNAYAEGVEIHVHENRGEPATTVHESMHLFSHADWLPRAGFNANEGATEYFTKKLCAEIKLKRGNFYEEQHRAVRDMIDFVGETAVAEAYFKGKVAELETAFDKASGATIGTTISNWWSGMTGGTQKTGAGEFQKWLDFMKAGKYAEARALT